MCIVSPDSLTLYVSQYHSGNQIQGTHSEFAHLNYIEAPSRHIDVDPAEPTSSPSPVVRDGLQLAQLVQLPGQSGHSANSQQLKHNQSPGVPETMDTAQMSATMFLCVVW